MWQRLPLHPSFTTVLSRSCLSSKRLISTTPPIYLNQKWREQRGLSANPNARGVLTDTPDYTFLDGRPTPYGVGQRNRIVKHQEITKQIIQLTAEVDFAVERYEGLKEEERDRRQKILDNKLRPKGIELLKKKKN